MDGLGGFKMPSSEAIYEATADVRERAIKKLVSQGHSLRSAEEIVKRMSYEEQAQLIGQQTGLPYSPY